MGVSDRTRVWARRLTIAAFLGCAALALGAAIRQDPHPGVLDRADAWIRQGEFRVVAQFTGADRSVNLTANVHGESARGDLQVLDINGHQVTYVRFRVSSGQVEVRTVDIEVETRISKAPAWVQDDAELGRMILDAFDPDVILGSFREEGRFDNLGQAGEAWVYRHENGSQLFIVHGEPARVVAKSVAGWMSASFEFD